MKETAAKILYLMEYPIDLPGGAQESTKTLCTGLAASGEFAPVVACPDLLASSPGDYPFEIVTYHSDENRELSKARRLANFFSRIGSFYRIIKHVKPDIIHVSMSESLITFGFLRVPGFFSDIPFVYTDRGLCTGYRKHSLACIKAAAKRAERFIVTTGYNGGLWARKIDAPITVIPNTISGAFSEFDHEGRAAARAEYGIEDDEIVIGFAGRISEEKDWPHVPDVVEAAKKSGVRLKAAVVMSLYEERDEAISESVRDRIASLIGSENLIYMQDLDQKGMSRFYYLVDIFIMTSCFESFGKAAVEAMSRKCAILSTAVGGLPEVIGNPEDLYDMNGLGKVTERIRQLADDPELLSAEREMFYRRYRDNYTADKNIESHAKVYRELLSGRR
ncbi:MAG: glycosyltransferase family 4 protein [Lachnospiraceae bacterium]|nr:glycosyltransferase family 4 protein [Lachnospiraceae bacterium]